jgi:CheY-like chemotaxis protein
MGMNSDNLQPLANRLLAGASQELRTSLNAVLGMLDLALAEELSPTVTDYLTTARQAAKSLSKSIELLLDTCESPPDLGRRDLLDLADVVYVAVADLAAAARHADREILVRLLPDVPMHICGDASRLEHILRSLVEHSLKWLDSRRIVVEVAGRIDVGKTQLEIGVSEWGLGTVADRHNFVEYDPADASKYSSAGLGLAISQGWLKELGGGLWTDAQTSCGRFYATLELPLPDRFRHEALPPVAPRLFSTRIDGGHLCLANTTTARPLHVLVVDDTPANQKVVQSALRKRGHHVELADNGRQAVERLRQHPFDVVLMDAQMPQMNGLEATAAIRSLPDHQRARVPIIAMTAHTLQEDRMRCLAAGMDDYLPKPLDVSDLVARVESFAEAARAEQPQSAATAAEDERNFLAATLARLGGDEHLLHELIRLFQQDAQTLLERLRGAVASGDAESTARAAHNLRGLSANFDDEPTVASAGDIERAAQRKDLSAASAAIPQLEMNLDRLLGLLERYQAHEAS